MVADASVSVWVLDDLYFVVAPTDTDGDGFTVAGGDCDDADGARHPGAPAGLLALLGLAVFGFAARRRRR